MQYAALNQRINENKNSASEVPVFWEDAEEAFVICNVCTEARDRLSPNRESKAPSHSPLSSADFARLLDAP